MSKTLRTALIWMLMLALPAQSMAAIGMQLCAVTKQSGVASPASQQLEAHHPGAIAMPQHADASSQAGHHGSTTTDELPVSADNSLCSLCAFCVGAVALTSVAIGSSPQPTSEPSLARLERFVGFIADTPERPPRPFLA